MTHSPISTSSFPQFQFADSSADSRQSRFLLSFFAHLFTAAIVIALAIFFPKDPHGLPPKISRIFDGSLSFPSTDARGGNGSGGTHDKIPPSTGALPKMTLETQLTPPEAVLVNSNPLLPAPPTIMGLSAVPLPDVGPLGDPLSRVRGPASNGPGGGEGIGENCCGGVGPGKGPGFGPYDTGNIFQPGRGGVSAPRPVYDPNPEYSNEARAAKLTGDVILQVVVGADGNTYDIQVQHGLGLGLDEKAKSAVKEWKFEPSMLDGHAVPVRVVVAISFRLF